MRYPFLVLANIFFGIVCLCTNWLWPLFAKPKLGPSNNGAAQSVEPRLPSWLSWFMTPDNSLLGDANFQAQHDGGYGSQVAWLYRNPGYGFDANVLAAKIPAHSVLTIHGDPRISDSGNKRLGLPAIAGRYLIRCAGHFHFLWIKRIGTAHCIHAEFGWGLHQFWDCPELLNIDQRAAFKFSPRFAQFVAIPISS